MSEENKTITDPATSISTGNPEDLTPTQTAGYKAPPKKTVEELAKLDQEDESLRKWKESLGVAAGGTEKGPVNDPRKLIIYSMHMEVDGRADVLLDLSSPEAISGLKEKVIVIKEGTEYRLKIKFKVQHELVAGIKYLQVVKRLGLKVDRLEEMMGSYAPKPEIEEIKFPPSEAPSGMLARGTYDVHSKFVDDDDVTHLEFQWKFEIKKDWN